MHPHTSVHIIEKGKTHSPIWLLGLYICIHPYLQMSSHVTIYVNEPECIYIYIHLFMYIYTYICTVST